MKAARPLIILLCLWLLGRGNVQAQLLPTDSMLARVLQTDELLPLLIDSAIKYSGEVNRTISSIDVWKESEKVDRKSVFNGLSFVSSYNYGTTGDLTLGNDVPNTSQFANFRSSKSDRYNMGVNLQIPLGNLLSRKNTIRISQLQAKMAEGEKESSKQYVKQEVIRMYQELKLAQRLLITSSKNKQVAFVNNTMAEKDFLNAGGDLETISRLGDIYNKANIDFETYLNRFQTSFLLLQSYTNTPLAQLIANRK